MAVKIENGYHDTKYIVFGDEQRMYQFLATPNKAVADSFDFELRRDDVPAQIFAEFSVNNLVDMSFEQVFIHGLERAKSEVDSITEDYVSKSQFPKEAREGLIHLQDHISKTCSELGDARLPDSVKKIMSTEMDAGDDADKQDDNEFDG